MDIGAVLRAARQRANCSLRTLAQLAGTSHSALAAYESGAKVPRADTMVRILQAAGHCIAVTPAEGHDFPAQLASGRQLEQVLLLAAQFPARHERELIAPRFGRAG